MYFNENLKSELERKVSDIISRDTGKLKPIIKIDVKGNLPKGVKRPIFSNIINKYSGKAILKINRKMKGEDFEKKVELLRSMREGKLSPEEQGLLLLRENLKQASCMINPDEIFEPLLDGDTDKLFSRLIT